MLHLLEAAPQNPKKNECEIFKLVQPPIRKISCLQSIPRGI